jgi:POT family proton-dependent oligopeptide transporter
MICFGTELWERFSYYGMRALLIYYLTEHFLYSDRDSYAIYGAYTALAWGLPVIGGIVADRYLGARKAVTVGALLLASGHLLLAWKGPAAMQTMVHGNIVVERDPQHLGLFFLALSLIVSGVGFLKSNISSIVGTLYTRDDPRRDAGFTIFYLGINLGAAISPLLCGWLGQTYGWHYGFGLAGLGMLAGLLLFLWGQKFLDGSAEPPNAFKLRQAVILGVSREWLVYACIAVLVIVVWLLIRSHEHVGTALGAFGVLLATTILHFSFFRCTPVERDRMLAVGVLIVFSIVFWSFYEQMGSSLNLFSDRLVDRRVLGWEVKASQLQALPAIFVILLAPLFTILWSVLASRQTNPSVPAKLAVGLALLGAAFFMPVLGAAVIEPGQKVGLIWFVAMFALMVGGELCMTPIAMNLISRMCPARIVGMMMGTYFLSLSIGSFVAGQLAKLTSFESDMDFAGLTALRTYLSSFELFGCMSLGVGAMLYVASPILHRRMHESGLHPEGALLERQVRGRTG